MRLLVNTAELGRVAGTQRDIVGDVDPSEIGIVDDRLTPDVPIHVALQLESVNDGVIVTGTVAAQWRGQCRRCLEPVADVATAVIDERYQYTVTDPDAFQIDHDHLDLVPLVREAVLLELPDAPLCRPDCAGLCETCGANRNDTICSCVAEPVDVRWGALDELRRTLEP